MDTKIYFVQSKADDYGACVTELVQATKRNAKEYYEWKQVPAKDVEVLKKYLPFIDADEEAERDDDMRFYGTC